MNFGIRSDVTQQFVGSLERRARALLALSPFCKLFYRCQWPVFLWLRMPCAGPSSLRSIALSLTLFGAAAGAAASGHAHSIAWSSLSYDGLFSSAKIGYATVTAEHVQANLIQTGGYDPIPLGSDVVHEIRLSGKSIGAKEENVLWQNEDGNALQRVRTDPEEDGFSSYRYLSNGVWREYKKDGKEDVKGKFYPYPDGLDAQLVHTEGLGLFYILGISDIRSPGDRIRLFAFSRRGSTVLDLVAEEVTRIKVNYDEHSPDSTRKVKGEVNVLRISAKPEGGELEFLGLKSDVNIYLDAATGIPVRITGKRYGNRKVKLRKVVLR